MSVKNSIQAVPLSSLASTSFSSSYAKVNTNGFPNPISVLRIINNSDKDVTVSYDGVNDHDYIPTMTSLTLNLQINNQPNNQIANMAKGVSVWVKGSAGMSGSIYVTAYFLPVVN